MANSTICWAAARRSERSLIYCYDERRETFTKRCVSLGIDMPAFCEQGRAKISEIAAGEISIDEFAQHVCGAVQREKTYMVVLDSLSGWVNALAGEKDNLPQLHELLNH